ncbi:cation:proton antiporter [bacterium]|nr:cation:proton antiporter [bacterium]
MEIGALFAGITLATSPYRFEITSRMKVLKDFFIVIYFVLLGSNLSFNGSINWLFILA